MNKKLGFLCVVLTLLCGQVFALEVGDNEIDITVSETFVSRYIWRGQDLYGENDAAHQPSIDIVAPEAFCGADLGINLWASLPLSHGHENGEEYDYTVSLSKTLLKSLDASAGIMYFDFPNSGSTSDVVESWMAFTLNNILPELPIKLAANLFLGYDFQATSGGPDEGWYYSWGFSTDLALPESGITQEGQTLSLEITNWGQDGVADLEPSMLYATDLSVSTSYSFGDFSIDPSINYMINHVDEINSGNDEFWTGCTFSYVF